jgi:hypothetical protein
MREVGVVVLACLVPLMTGCPSVDLGNNPVPPARCAPDRQYFDDVIWPEMLAPSDPARSCVAAGGCHDIGNSPRSGLRLEPDITMAGALDDNYRAATAFLTCGFPMGSPLLTKPSAESPDHGGGVIFAGDDPVVSAFESWFP